MAAVPAVPKKIYRQALEGLSYLCKVQPHCTHQELLSYVTLKNGHEYDRRTVDGWLTVALKNFGKMDLIRVTDSSRYQLHQTLTSSTLEKPDRDENYILTPDGKGVQSDSGSSDSDASAKRHFMSRKGNEVDLPKHRKHSMHPVHPNPEVDPGAGTSGQLLDDLSPVSSEVFRECHAMDLATLPTGGKTSTDDEFFDG